MEALLWGSIAGAVIFAWGWIGHVLWQDYRAKKHQQADRKRYWD